MGNVISFIFCDGRHFHKIIHNLFIGDKYSIYDPFFKKQKKILVINATKNIEFNLKLSSINIRVPVDDDRTVSSNEIMLNMMENITFIMQHYLEKDYIILVHCVAGIQRSCSLVSAYLMRYKNISMKKSMYIIQKMRPQAFITGVNFEYALVRFQFKKL